MSDEIVKDNQVDLGLTEKVENTDADEQEAVIPEKETEQEADSGDNAEASETDAEKTTDEPTEAGTFTQDDVDKIVSERLGRQEKKLKRELSRTAELQAGVSTQVDDSIIYDPDTGMPLDANDTRYQSIKTQRDTQKAIEYNNQLNVQQLQFNKMQDEEQKLVMEVESNFDDQLNDLQSVNSDGYELLKKENLLSKPQCFGMLQAISDNHKGVQVLADLMKNDSKEAIRISNLPYGKQLLAMTKLIHIKSKGAGSPIVKSKAPPPVSSFGSEVGTSVNKSAEEMTFEELYQATRKRNKFLY